MALGHTTIFRTPIGACVEQLGSMVCKSQNSALHEIEKNIGAYHIGVYNIFQDLSMMHRALWDQRHSGAIRICQWTRLTRLMHWLIAVAPSYPPSHNARYIMLKSDYDMNQFVLIWRRRGSSAQQQRIKTIHSHTICSWKSSFYGCLDMVLNINLNVRLS